MFPHLDGHLDLALTERTTMPLTEASALAMSWLELKTSTRERSEMPSAELMASGIDGRGPWEQEPNMQHTTGRC